jgi:hypothetical protein
MSSAAKAPKQEPDRRLEYYRNRDDFMRAYQPASEEERLLVNRMAQAWRTLQEAYELRAQVIEKTGLYELFTNDLERYKLLHRGITDAERIWRHALEEFQRARRRRERHSFESLRRPASGRTTVVSERAPSLIPVPPELTAVHPPSSGSLAESAPPTPTRELRAPPSS